MILRKASRCFFSFSSLYFSSISAILSCRSVLVSALARRKETNEGGFLVLQLTLLLAESSVFCAQGNKEQCPSRTKRPPFSSTIRSQDAFAHVSTRKEPKRQAQFTTPAAPDATLKETRGLISTHQKARRIFLTPLQLTKRGLPGQVFPAARRLACRACSVFRAWTQRPVKNNGDDQLANNRLETQKSTLFRG